MKLCVAGMKHCGSTMVMNMLRIASMQQGIEVNHIIDDDNFCRLISEEPTYNIELTIPSTSGPSLSHEPKNIIHKTHEFLKEIEDENYFVVLPLRDIRDCAISHFMRFQKDVYCNPKNDVDTQYDERRLVTMAGVHLFILQMLENIRLFNVWYDNKNLKHYIFSYEKYKKDPHSYVSTFLKSLSFPSDEEFVKNIVEKTETYRDRDDLPTNLDAYINMETKTYDLLLTKDHNTSGGKINKFKSFFNEYENSLILENDTIYSFLKEWGYIT
jgi:hypothetical protein